MNSQKVVLTNGGSIRWEMPKKLFLYCLLLLPLFVIYYIKLVDLQINLFRQSSVIFLVLIILTLFGLWVFKRDLRGSSETLPIITNIQRKEHDYFAFLSVFILPLFSLSLTSLRDWIALSVILIFMGIVYIRGGFLYMNPIFLLFGWYLYKGLANGKEIIFLSDDCSLPYSVEKGYH